MKTTFTSFLFALTLTTSHTLCAADYFNNASYSPVNGPVNLEAEYLDEQLERSPTSVATDDRRLSGGTQYSEDTDNVARILFPDDND